MAPTRAESPAPGRRPADGNEKKVDAAGAASNGGADAVTAAPAAAEAPIKEAEAPAPFLPPPRPAGLRGSLLRLHAALAGGVTLFAVLGQSMVHPIQEGKFQRKDGVLIDIGAFDPVEQGPYPKCHPHFGEHEATFENGTTAWVKNSAAPAGGPYPAGHPENKEWLAKSSADAAKEIFANRFTWAGLQPNLHLLTLASLCVILGSKHAVWLFTDPPDTREVSQLLQEEDAYWFPIMGSCVLFGLFCVLQYLGTAFIKKAISCGIVVVCMFGLGSNLDHLVVLMRNKNMKPLFVLPLFDQPMSAVELVGMCIGGVMAASFFFSTNWIINNVFGVSFCLVGIKRVGISSFKTGAVMLIGLFFYDVFWVFGSKPVFGSNVMVSVAKGVEAPIKLMFPRSFGGCGTLQHSMLGLGDIVVPGIFIAYLAKWDAQRMGESKAKSFVYLTATMIAYILSLITTVSIMLFFNAAQPALLYIVPYVLVTTVVVAVCRGEFKELWDWEIAEEVEVDAAEAEGAKPTKQD